jgi:hypothetical protein
MTMSTLLLSFLLSCSIMVVMAARPTKVLLADREHARTRVWTTALPEPLFDLLEPDLRAIAVYERSLETLVNDKKRTRWFPAGQRPKTALEVAILRLAKLAQPGGNNAGFEWWTQIVNSGDPIGFHVDKDESIASLKHYLVHPIISSVFYITDIGGGTLITGISLIDSSICFLFSHIRIDLVE